MALLPLPAVEDAPEAAQEQLKAIARARGRAFNVYRLLANSPPVLQHIYGLASALWNESQLPRDLQELAILRAAQLSGCRYEWTRHLGRALETGVSADKISALAGWPTARVFDEREVGLLNLVDATLTEPAVAAAAVERAKRHFSEQQVLEFVALASFYLMLARILQTLECDAEPGDEALMDGFVNSRRQSAHDPSH